ncbi:GIY-YIG nuclease family protein [Ruegeria sp. HKCCSP335]|uniref:GIY-YIG nuclease family protein n=1 Tax=Ruegeria sp. HKCCSP335 TaxID=2794833 RepID=UPI001FD78423|nr:GIY-YIG nuclease family protein [Ruegeria sp. HKCCSP335]
MTRRLEPYDRVRELGDASVPFLFDTHAMIYSDDAPALEKTLHAEYENRRVNTANYRKEFFRVNVDEVEEAVKRLAPAADFFRDIEAQEFHETMSKRKQEAEQLEEEKATEFPDEI